MFTGNKYMEMLGSKEEAIKCMKSWPDVTYICFGFEVAPETGMMHVQGYVEFDTRKQLSTLKNLGRPSGVNTYYAWTQQIHWEPIRHVDNWMEARNYCHKPETPKEDLFEWNNNGEVGGRYDRVRSKQKQGKRTDLDLIRDEIVAKRIKTTTDLENYHGLTFQGLAFGDRLLRNVKPTRTSVPDVYWFHGRTGVGKSRWVHEFADRLELTRGYKTWIAFDSKLKWFDGYNGQEIVLFDDFRGGECSFNTLLRITDRYITRVEIKGATTWWYPKIILFTSSKNVTASFSNIADTENVDQFVRRVEREGGGGEWNFNDELKINEFRGRIDSFTCIVPSNDAIGRGAEEKEEKDNTTNEIHGVSEGMQLGPLERPMPVDGVELVLDDSFNFDDFDIRTS
jgi:hypothetical protein